MSPTSRLRQTMSEDGVGKPVVSPIASASGIARRTASASAVLMRGRRRMRFISSSSNSPIWMGERRTWNAFVPITAPAMFSFTYAFMPWMTATTATRNATETMMPTRVKNERSLLARISPNATLSRSVKRISTIAPASVSELTAGSYRLTAKHWKLSTASDHLIAISNRLEVDMSSVGLGRHRCGVPAFAGGQQVIDDREEFPGGRDQRQLLPHAAGDEALIKGADRRIVPGRDEGGHVERSPHDRAPAADPPPAAPLPAVGVERRDTGQLRDGLPRERPEFGKLGEQG